MSKECCEPATTTTPRSPWIDAAVSLGLLILGFVLDLEGYPLYAIHTLAYLPVGFPVLKKAWTLILKGDVFTEFFLMGIATLGAFAIGETAEAVAVMLFYAVGELFQDMAVNRAKGNIQSLLDLRPNQATVFRNEAWVSVKPELVRVGERIQVKPGERVPLDSELIGASTTFNTAALTGESKPKRMDEGTIVLSGMVNLDRLTEFKVTKPFQDSAMSRILDLVQHATTRKAKTEQFIRRFARIYTPIVTGLAVALTIVPILFVDEYVFRDWLYRALVFLVISCPCALVISIPLGYFGGIGAASRKGILFKGSNFLDQMSNVTTVVFDKTGTLTKGEFAVQRVVSASDSGTDDWVRLAASLESKSTHPIATALVSYAKKQGLKWTEPETVTDVPGHGLIGTVDGRDVLVGNTALMTRHSIKSEDVASAVHVAVDGTYAGHLQVSDDLKDDAAETIRALTEFGIREIVLLSGDSDAVTQSVAKSIGIETAFGGLLPEQKVAHLDRLKQDPSRVIVFVGDGINDAPVLALSDIGVAMGGLGSDAAIETADVVIQNDEPSRLLDAIRISRFTRRVVYQNIGFAFGVKFLVLLLGAGGLATMWEAVFADVGVALLAILNAIRIQK